MPSVRAIGTPNRAAGVHTRRSQASAIAQPPPAATPCDLRDRRHRDALEPSITASRRRSYAMPSSRGRELRELPDVGAGGKRLAGGAQMTNTRIAGVGVHALARLDERVVHRPRQRVAGLGAVERQECDRPST